MTYLYTLLFTICKLMNSGTNFICAIILKTSASSVNSTSINSRFELEEQVLQERKLEVRFHNSIFVFVLYDAHECITFNIRQ